MFATDTTLISALLLPHFTASSMLPTPLTSACQKDCPAESGSYVHGQELVLCITENEKVAR